MTHQVCGSDMMTLRDTCAAWKLYIRMSTRMCSFYDYLETTQRNPTAALEIQTGSQEKWKVQKLGDLMKSYIIVK